MKERYKLIPEVFVVLFHGGGVVLGQRLNTGWMDGKWGLPGGHGEDKETVRQAAAREAKEELGIDIDTHDLELILVQHRWCDDKENPHARVGFYFAPKKFGGTVSNAEPHKCAEVQTFAFTELPQETVPHVRAALTAIQEGRDYDEFDWETLRA